MCALVTSAQPLQYLLPESHGYAALRRDGKLGYAGLGLFEAHFNGRCPFELGSSLVLCQQQPW